MTNHLIWCSLLVRCCLSRALPHCGVLQLQNTVLYQFSATLQIVCDFEKGKCTTSYLDIGLPYKLLISWYVSNLQDQSLFPVNTVDSSLIIAMLRKLTLLLNFLVISAYNIDTTYPLIYPDNATNARQYNWTSDKHDYFGYSVLLHHDSQKNTSW